MPNPTGLLASSASGKAPMTLATTSGALTLTTQQQAAIDKIDQWYRDPDAPQVFRLFGYAGTGKTTIARHAVDTLSLGEAARYAAFTGKAAYVLRSKGCDDASTVHSLIYQPVEKTRARLRELEKERDEAATAGQPVDLLDGQINAERAKLAQPMWVLKDDSPLTDAPLLVLDEVSMIGRKIAADLLSFGVKLLVLGDPAQLPPVGDEGYFIDAAPDHLLDEIHRSALDSAPTRIATAVRTSLDGDRMYGVYGPDGNSGRYHRLATDTDLLGYDQVICGKNATRWRLINDMRRLAGRVQPHPEPGERIVPLNNNPTRGVFNGQQLTVEHAEHDPKHDVVLIEAVDDDGRGYEFPAWASGFRDLKGEKDAKFAARGPAAPIAATYAAAITCHKAQGSQWPRVLVYDESATFAGIAWHETRRGNNPDRAPQAADLAGRRWLYTAATRASEQVVLLGGFR